MHSIIIFNLMRKDHHTIFGINGCTAILQSKKYKIIEIIIQSGSPAEKDGKITHALGYHGGHIKVLSSSQFKSNFHQWRTQGIVVRFSGRIDCDLPSYKNQTDNIGLLMLDGIEDPQNLGQIIRTSECAGIDGIIISKHSNCGITDTVLQVSQGAFTQVPIHIVSNLNQTATQLKKEDFWITAVENGIQSKNWYEIDFKGKMLIIVGSEGRGIKKLNLENSDFQTTIPMQGEINSLNVSAAVSAILFERLRQLSIE